MRALVLALFAVACTRDPGPSSIAPGMAPEGTTPNAPGAPLGSPGCGKAAMPGVHAEHAAVEGRDRSYVVVVPPGYAPQKPYPVVFVLHGSSGNGNQARAATDLERVANGGAIFVYPNGLGEWDLDDPAESNRDVALFDRMLLHVHNALCTNPQRIFLTGFSNGAYMSNQLACRRGDRIRGVVTNAGGGPYELHGTYDANGNLVCPGKPVAALVIHGTADTSVAPTEGQKSLDHWTFANRCSDGETGAPNLPAPCVLRSGCSQPVGVCRVPGLGHSLWRDSAKATWSFIEALR
jgi:polyhydroxybutyrate depolymerase